MDAIGVWVISVAGTALLTWGVATAVTVDKTANECDKLGAFYTGDVVYDCKRKGED